MSWNKFLIKVDRFFAWTLLVTMLFYFLSGYGITKNIISAQFSYNLHTIYLPVVILTAFIGHTSYAIHLALKRWRIWNGYTRALLITFYAAFLIFFLYIQMFYKPNASSETKSTSQASDNEKLNSSASEESPSATVSGPASDKTFTLAELSKYNGRNGNPAYVAVDGVVYDVSAVFINGRHFSHLAGSELSNAFYLQHAKSAITKYPAVGLLQS